MKWIIENLKTLFYALIIAVIIRSLLIQPFYIPSSSMEPNLLVGDRLFVTKFSYGYSKHSFPFSPPIYPKRLFFSDSNEVLFVFFDAYTRLQKFLHFAKKVDWTFVNFEIF